MKRFCFTVDDNIRFLRELTESSAKSIFDHPYANLYKRLHEKHGVAVQLNLFFEEKGYTLSDVTDRFKDEWEANSDWLKLSFHSKWENVKPYEFSDYDEVYEDCSNVHREILRFATPNTLAKTTTVHYCRATKDGLRALRDCGVEGLLGLYGTEEEPRSSYQSTPEDDIAIRRGEIVTRDEISYAGIDIVLNLFSVEEILAKLSKLSDRDLVKIMIHEQYFYEDYTYYQPNFEQKLDEAFGYLITKGFRSHFFENIINNK